MAIVVVSEKWCVNSLIANVTGADTFSLNICRLTANVADSESWSTNRLVAKTIDTIS